MSFLNRFRKQTEPAAPEAPPAPAPIPSKAKGFIPPPPRPALPATGDPKLARLQQRRQALEHAIELVEQSGDPNSSFQQRIAVLGATLDSIEAEIQQTLPLPPRTLPDLPAIPIEHIGVSLDPVPSVSFSIGPARFAYAEEIDWAERGTQIVKGDLVPVEVDIDRLIPDSIAGSVRDELAAHLERSLFSFATDLRDRAVEGDTQPVATTLTDLAISCPRCGDWQLWGSICLRCLEHERRLRELNAERSRVLDERTSEVEERQRQVEELPLQRRRLAETIASIQALQS